MTKFLILSALRSFAIISLLSYLSSSIIAERGRRLAIVGVVTLLVCAALDGVTPDGWEFEYALGSPFYFYIFANAPVVMLAMCIVLAWPRKGISANG